MSIFLWVVGCTEAEFSATNAKQLPPEGIEKNWVMLQDNSSRKPMQLTKDVHEQGGHPVCRIPWGYYTKVSSLGVMVDDDIDVSKPVRRE